MGMSARGEQETPTLAFCSLFGVSLQSLKVPSDGVFEFNIRGT